MIEDQTTTDDEATPALPLVLIPVAGQPLAIPPDHVAVNAAKVAKLQELAEEVIAGIKLGEELAAFVQHVFGMRL